MPRTKFSNDDINVMGDSFVFKRLPEPEMMVILKECLVKRFSPGEIILKEGDMGRGVYIILEGDVEVYLPKLSVTGENRPTEVNLAKLTPGVCFGEYSLLDEKRGLGLGESADRGTTLFLFRIRFPANLRRKSSGR